MEVAESRLVMTKRTVLDGYLGHQVGGGHIDVVDMKEVVGQ
jgi:hypothetical protein